MTRLREPACAELSSRNLAFTFNLSSELVAIVFQISVLADAMDRFNGRNRGSGGGGATHGDVFRRVSRMSRRSFRCGNLFCQIDGSLELTLLKVVTTDM